MNKFIAVFGIILTCFAASSSNAATIPAGTALTVRTTSQISAGNSAGRTFTARVDQDVVVNGATLLRAGADATGRIQSAGSSSRPAGGRSAPLSLQLTSISVNGRSVAIRTDSVQPPATATQSSQQMRRGVVAGNMLVTRGTTMQFQLTRAVSL